MTIPFDSANERLKAGFDSWMWISMMAAVLVHFATFAYWPEMSVTVNKNDDPGINVLPPLPPIKLPDAPKRLDRPALPVVSSVDLNEDVTISKTTFDANPVSELPPPPTKIEQVAVGAGNITPFTIPPRILNADAVVRALQREYPSVLRNSGIGGTVNVTFSIDEEGRVLATSVDQGSTYKALDDAALAVADVIRFSPAYNRDQRVAVRVTFPIVFEVVGTRQ